MYWCQVATLEMWTVRCPVVASIKGNLALRGHFAKYTWQEVNVRKNDSSASVTVYQKSINKLLFNFCSAASYQGHLVEIIVRQIALRGSPLQVPQKRFETFQPPTNEQHFKMKRINFFWPNFQHRNFFTRLFFNLRFEIFFVDEVQMSFISLAAFLSILDRVGMSLGSGLKARAQKSGSYSLRHRPAKKLYDVLL